MLCLIRRNFGSHAASVRPMSSNPFSRQWRTKSSMGKFARKSLIVAHFAFFQIDGQLIVVDLCARCIEFATSSSVRRTVEESILGAVVGENIGKRR